MIDWLDSEQTISYSRPYASAFCSNLKAPSSPGKAGEEREFAIGREGDFSTLEIFVLILWECSCVHVFKVGE